ncbi:hypothetical protein [Dactylosporangium sp. NPDC051541]|uniref:hypothetical protein n=1 Tax=Dactylosporangium sp. NPDC051541 TaxID=3363977 RepID=UPI00378B2B90
MTDDDPLIAKIVAAWSGCTLPVGPRSRPGTAFFYNELVESTPDGDTVREWLVTADRLSRPELGEIRLRPEIIEPAGAASAYLAVRDFAGMWQRHKGVAVTRTFFLHDHAERKGWAWSAEQVTDGLAAKAEHVKAVDGEPRGALALGHIAREPGEPGEPRPLAAANATLARDPDRVIRWQGWLPAGFAGAPVFVLEARGPEVVLRCLGALATAGNSPAVLTFDVIRALIAATVRPKPPKRGWLRFGGKS